MPRLALTLLVLSLALTSACGEEAARVEPTPRATVPAGPPAKTSGRVLTKEDAFVIGTAIAATHTYCRGSSITGRRFRELVDDLIALAQEKPDDAGSTFGEKVNTPRSGLQDIADHLAEHDCAPATEGKVRGVLRRLG